MINIEGALSFATDNSCAVSEDEYVRGGERRKLFVVQKGGEKVKIEQFARGSKNWVVANTKMTRAKAIVEAVRILSKGNGLY